MAKLKKLSIIIPTYNEEKYLPLLLKSIKKQSFKDYEIIVADNNSKDKTRDIAKKFGCIITKGGNPAKARNNGAKIAKYNFLFLDSDVILSKGFLKNFLEKIEKYEKKEQKKLDYATCRVVPLTSKSKILFSYMLKNIGNFIFPNHVSGQCIFIKKEAFNSISGFDESLFLAEEHDLAERLNKKKIRGKFFNDIFVFNIPRRQEKEGTYRTLIKDIYSETYRIFKKKIKKPIYKKEYGHY